MIFELKIYKYVRDIFKLLYKLRGLLKKNLTNYFYSTDFFSLQLFYRNLPTKLNMQNLKLIKLDTTLICYAFQILNALYPNKL